MVGHYLKKQSLLTKVASSILLLVVLFWPVWGYAQDTFNAPLTEPDEEMDTFLLMLALCAIFLMGVIFTVTVALIFITVLMLLGLIAAGIVASSVFVGMYEKSWTAGFKTAWYSIVILLASVTGVAGIGISSYLFILHASKPTILILGLLTGLLGGTFIAWVNIKFLRFIMLYFQKHNKFLFTSTSTTDPDNR
jgi:MFS family permease